MPIYNEAKHLQKTIDSVLAQTFTDFTLFISDNYSTDGSSAIVDAAAQKDRRVKKVSPPYHMTSIDHGRYVLENVLNAEQSYKYSIFIGGHDLWKPDLLQCLWASAEVERNPSVVYTDCYEIDESENVLKKWEDLLQTKTTPRSVVPHYVLLGLTHNIVWGGLWREDKRRNVWVRHSCCGADHFLIAEVALLGNLVYQPGSAVFLRKAAEYSVEGAKAYVRKHIPASVQKQPIQDFVNQLEWAAYLVDKAVEGDSLCSQGPAKDMLKNSLLSAYICRYWHNMDGFEGGFETFFNHPKIKSIMGAEMLCIQLHTELSLEISNENTDRLTTP